MNDPGKSERVYVEEMIDTRLARFRVNQVDGWVKDELEYYIQWKIWTLIARWPKCAAPARGRSASPRPQREPAPALQARLPAYLAPAPRGMR